MISSIACEDGKICDDATCVPVLCTPDAYSCDDDRLEQCNAKGTGLTLVDPCGDGEVCSAAANGCI